MNINNLSIREKIGQTLIHMPNPEKEAATFGNLQSFFRSNPVGGIFSLNREGENYSYQLLKRYNDYFNASSYPILHADDMEFGAGSNIEDLTALPHLMALGAADDEELAYNYGKSLALEARCAGVNICFCPVADLSLNPLNPLVNHRAVSDDPELAIRILKNIIKGMQDHGVAATIKHFPGDGTDFRDQHLCTSSNTLSVKEWYDKSGRVFKALIDDGVYAIMTGHINFPAYQSEKIKGINPPASLSHEITTRLLKEELGFKGVVVTDALVMAGFKGYYPDEQADIECFKAGSDLFLWPHPNYINNLEKAVKSGEVTMTRLDDAVTRILNMKKKLGLFEPHYQTGLSLNNEIKNLAKHTGEKIAEKSVTLVKNLKNVLPLQKEKITKLLVVGITSTEVNYKKIEFFREAFTKRGIQADFQQNLLFEQNDYQDTISQDYDHVLFVINRYPHHPIGPQSFWGNEAESIWAANSIDPKKVIVISLGNPYYANEYFERINTYVNTYSYTPFSIEATVAALFGENEFTGKSPVNLNMNKFKA
ncbi:MAG: glycoside hydrolase family 3 protein [Bacteroidetes bacterium]|jgi:beta-N-acetylhexosaminidase|nr:glycoside hydrolase family 3 protein [Bacteroidota bacterium]